ncbi:MAG: GAF domain-containing protein [Candidatus Marinimicrobia bacterium]|nr:GAF domain-containing protein [Candidatus Neomarinimicrobiota bacterium]
MVTIIFVTVSFLVGFIAYRTEMKMDEDQVREFYLQKANLLANDIIYHAHVPDQEIFSHIVEAWRSIGPAPEDEYICIVDSTANLIMHTLYPETINSYAGDNLIVGTRTTPACNLIDLVNKKQVYTGGYISSTKESQLAVFVPILEKNWVLGLHRSQKALRQELFSRLSIHVLSFLLVSCLLLPLSLFVLYRLYRSAWKKQEEIKSQYIRSEERFRKMYEESPIAIELFNKEGDLISFNQACIDLFGVLNVNQFKKFNLFKDPNLPKNIKAQLKQSENVNHQVKFDFSKLKETQQFDTSKSGIIYLNVYVTVFKTASDLEEIGYLAQLEDVTERRITEHTLETQRHLLRKMAENYPHSYIAILEEDLTITLLSGQELKLNQLNAEDYIGKSITAIMGEFSPSVVENLTKVFSGETADFEMEIIDTVYQFSALPLIDENGAITRILAVAENITEHKRNLRHIKNLNRVHAVLSNVNQAIVRLDDIKKLYEEVCQIIVDDGGFLMAWIGEFDSETGMVSILNSAGETGNYIDNLNIIVDGSNKAKGTTGKAVKDAQPAISNDIENDPAMVPWRESALRLGYRSSAAFPLFVKGKLKGSFTIYADTVGFFDTEEVKLLTELADDISFAMEHTEIEQEKLRSDSLFKARIELIEYAKDHSLSELLIKVIDLAEEMTNSQIGFLHFVEDDQQTIHSQVWSTNTTENICTLEPEKHSYSIHEAGVWIESLLETKAIIHNDYKALPNRKGLPEGHNPIIRQMVVPALRNGKVKLLLGIGNKHDNYTNEESSQISQLADFAWDVYERKLNEEKLIIKDLVFESSLAANCYTNKSGEIIHVNPAFLEIWGYSSDKEVTSKLAPEFFNHEQDALDMLDVINSIRQWQGEFNAKRADGTTFISRGFATQIRNNQSELIGYFATCTDVTEEIRIQNQLRQDDARLNSLLNIAKGLESAYTYADIPLALTNELITILGINTSWIYLFDEDRNLLNLVAAGGHLAPILTDKVVELIVAGDPFLEEIVQGTHIVLVEDGRTDPRTNKVIVNKLGNRSIVNVPFQLENGRLAILGLGTFWDEGVKILSDDDLKFLDTIGKQLIPVIDRIQVFEQRQKTEEMLLYNARRMKLLREIDMTIIRSDSIESTTSGVLSHFRQLIPCQRSSILISVPDTIDLFRVFALDSEKQSKISQGKIVKISEQWWKSLGENDLILVQDLESYKTDSSPIITQLRKEGFRSFVNAPLVIQDTFLGSLNLASVTPNFFTSEYLELIKEIRNHITIAIHQMNLKSEIEKSAKELEQRVANRTKQLEESNKELEDFTHTVSHDLRSPVRAVEGFTGILLEEYGDKLDKNGRNYLNRISKSAFRMEKLIDDLLEYSRFGMEDIVLVDVSLSRILKEVISFLEKEISESNATIDLPKDLPTVRAMKSQLSQIFVNLISNSIKYAKPGKPPKIKIQTSETESSTIITVSDNGIGIKPEFHEKIFDMFERLHSDEKIPGTGIGLAIVKKAIGKLSGNISVSSKLNHGTIFMITLQKAERVI